MEKNIVHLTIDNIPVEVEAGTTILEAARKINIDIYDVILLS
jgi:NADH dehydrogenase/NADH:ubiquinone oxidoreductase subunit G